jgi:hypothetical protein
MWQLEIEADLHTDHPKMDALRQAIYEWQREAVHQKEGRTRQVNLKRLLQHVHDYSNIQRSALLCATIRDLYRI